tara:strand:+ start:1352 stop:2095 length:744 start_codon:yes stop_codon:yes gene_type:complete
MIYSSEIKIPQIKNDPVSAKEFFKENGFLIERKHFQKNLCDKIINKTYSLDKFQNKIYKPLMMPHKDIKIFMDLMKDKELVNFMNLLIGDANNKIYGLQSEFFYGSPGTNGFAKHQDSYYTEPSISDGFGSAWIPIVDIEKKMGNLVVYKKSHLKGKLPVKKLNAVKDPNQDPNANNEETVIDISNQEEILINEKKGSIVFLHGDLVHSSIKNKTKKFRSVLLLTYIRSNCNFRPGNSAKRKLIPLD